MSAFDRMKKIEHEFVEYMAVGFWTPQDPLSEDEQDRLEHVQRDLQEFEQEQAEGSN